MLRDTNPSLAVTQCRQIAAELTQGRVLGAIGLALIATGLLLFLALEPDITIKLVLLASVLSGLWQKYLSLRTAIDTRVFNDWASRWDNEECSAETIRADLEKFDDVLRVLSGNSRLPRSLHERFFGAQRLFLKQKQVLLLQLALLLLATGLHFSHF